MRLFLTQLQNNKENKMKLIKNILTAALAVTLLALPAHATLVGYNTDPAGAFWDRGDADSGYAIFDTFTTPQFFNQTADSSFGTTTAFLSQSIPFGTEPSNPSGVTGGGDRIYLHQEVTSWTMTGTTTFGIESFVLQIKQFQGGGLFSTLAPTLNGLAYDNRHTYSFTEGADTNFVHQYAWDNLTASTNFTISFGAGPFSFASVDGVSADFSASADTVPEPSTALLLLGGLAALFGLRRRK
ncbi:MAG: PEP-CTERM sorting domain-containing protein [Verrucomicrobiota bacterium]